MKFADSVKQSASLTSTATISLGAVVAGYRTLAQAIADTAGKPEQVAVGDVVCMRVDDAADATKFEIADYTIGGTSSAPTLTRGTIRASSAGGANPVTFGGSVTVLCTVPSNYLAGLKIVRSIPFSTAVPLNQPGDSYMPQTTVNSALTFTPAAGAVQGALAYLRLVADGTNTPNFSAFREWGGSLGYLNTAGVVNEVQFFCDGADSWFSASQEINAQPVPVPATGVSFTGPNSGTAGSASSNFTVALIPSSGTSNGTTVTPSDAGAGGTFNPSSVVLTTATPAKTFTYTPSTPGTKTLSITNNGGLANGANIQYVSATAVSSSGHPMTMTNATYNGSGKFGSSLSGGYGTASALLSGTQITLEAWVKTAASGSLMAAAGEGGAMWMGMDTNGTAVGHYGDSPDVSLATSVAINDGNYHHLSLNVDSTGVARFYVDGVLAASSTTASAFNFGSAGNRFGAHWLPFGANSGGLNWVGEVDEVAVYSGLKRVANFSVPTAAATGNEANLLALYQFEGNGNDSITPPAYVPRFGNLTRVAESGSGPYTYTGSGASAGFGAAEGDSIFNRLLQNGVDGELVIKVLVAPDPNANSGFGSNELLTGIDSSNATGSKYGDIDYSVVNHVSGYQAFASGSAGAQSSVGCAVNDYIKMRRAGSTFTISVSKNAGGSYTDVASWTGVSTGIMYFHVLVTGTGSWTTVSQSGLA